MRSELLARFTRVTFNDAGLSLKGAALIDFLKGHDRAVIALERIDDEVLDALPELKIIAKYGVGLDNLDLGALERHGVKLGWRGGVNAHSVAELAIALMLMTVRGIGFANAEVRGGRWQQHVGGELRNSTVGIVGLGHVGKQVARLCQALGCRVIANDIRDLSDYCAANHITPVDLETLLSTADVVTLHVPFNDSTRRLLNADRLRMMKQGASLVNTARGGIVDEAAVESLLESNHLVGAAFDVFEVEPPLANRLIALPTFVATPHIGGSSREAILAMGLAAIDGLDTAEDVRGDYLANKSG